MKKLLLPILLVLSINSYAGSKWECIDRSLLSCHTWRMIVPTGWVVASDNSATEIPYYAITFVPDAKHEWKV